MRAFSKAVEQELAKAREKYPQGMIDAHHGYAKILEEIDEFWEECRKKESERLSPEGKLLMLKELIQVSAMAMRTAEDLGLIYED